MKIQKHRWLRWVKTGQRTGVCSTACHDCLSCSVFVTTALIVFLILIHLSLYSLVGKGSGRCWHWVQEGSRRVPLPSRNCRTRSTSRAATKSTTRTWAMINLNCNKGHRGQVISQDVSLLKESQSSRQQNNICSPQLEYLQAQTVHWILARNQ